MPRRAAADPDRAWKTTAGCAVLVLLALLVGGAFAMLASFAVPGPGIGDLVGDAYLRGVVLFTLEQAVLSTLLSVAGGVPLALALHRLRFPGRGFVLRLLLLPQALPVLVGALAILAVWGRGGVVSDGLAALGLPRLDVYGLSGILLAHVFFNMPLVARLALSALDAVPAESWKLAGQLSLGSHATFRVVEVPALARVLPGAASLVFMLCVTSFTLVLVLGGGPGATTLEVEVYQALRADFDPGRAGVLALLQVALTLAVLAVLLRFRRDADAGLTLGASARRFDRPSGAGRVVAVAVLVLGTAFVATPFAAVLARGLSSDLGRLLGEAAVRNAALTSLLVALGSALFALSLSAALLLGAEALRGDRRVGARPLRAAFDLAGALVLVVSPIVLGAGWFLGLRALGDVSAFAPLAVVAANGMMAMPFATRILGPPLGEAAERGGRLAASLGLTGLARLRLVEIPALRAPLGLAFAYALALSLGDFGVVALFGDQDFVTLPFLFYQRMGSYRTADAAGIALLLAALTLGLVLAAERLFARRETPR